jgi:hypothetical protein
MRLVYDATGVEVKIGDVVHVDGREPVVVTYFTKPHKFSSSGKVCINSVGAEGLGHEYYVGCIGATWIEREDHGWRPPVQLELNFN